MPTNSSMPSRPASYCCRRASAWASSTRRSQSSSRAGAPRLPVPMAGRWRQPASCKGSCADWKSRWRSRPRPASAGRPVADRELFALRRELANTAIRAATAAQLVCGAGGLGCGRRSARLIREAAFYGVLTPSLRHPESHSRAGRKLAARLRQPRRPGSAARAARTRCAPRLSLPAA